MVAVGLVATAGAMAALPLRPARQQGWSPYLTDVSAGLGTAFVALAALGVVAAALTGWWALPPLRARLRWAAPLVVLLVAVAATAWDGLYATCFGPGDPVIPVFEPAFTFVAVLLGLLVAPRSALSTRARLALGLLLGAPVVSLQALGWGVQGSPVSALVYGAIGGVPALLLGSAVGGAGPGDQRPGDGVRDRSER